MILTDMGKKSSMVNKNKITLLALAILVFIFFWVFSRFTVDDAFISWRYGKNLIDFGIWNYNPVSFDMTQAYTNPIFAALSIIPNLLNIDVVLFFKIFSILNVIVFSFYFYKKTRNITMLLVFFALPVSFIHVFSGLETFLFVSLLVALFINMYENNFNYSILLTILLFFTRPETWLFSLLIPFYFLIKDIDNSRDFKEVKLHIVNLIKFKFGDWGKWLLSTCIFSIVLGGYFIFHKLHFGFYLPNTFYIKATGEFNLGLFIELILFLIPMSFLVLFKRFTLLFIFIAFFFAVIVSYTTSDLMMNYAERFTYHLVAPIYFILAYLASQGHVLRNFAKYIEYTAYSVLTILFLLTFSDRLVKISNYYPRAIQSHAALGKVLSDISDKYEINSFSFGDAGMVSYYSKLVSLDNIGLGSSRVAQEGMHRQILDDYKLDMIVFHSSPEGVHLDSHGQQVLYDWAIENNFLMICDVYFRKEYTLRIYSKKAYPEILDLCKVSKQRNSMSEQDYFLQSIKNNPIKYWHE